MSLEVKVFRVGNSYVVSIPSQIAKLLDIGKGDKMRVMLDGNRLVYEKEGRS